MSLSRRQLLFGRIAPEPEAPAVADVNWFEPTRPDPVPARTAPVPGQNLVATVLPFDCLVGRGSFCSTCVEVCPVPGAISMSVGKPQVNADACTGCGDCVRRCPAPGGGIIVGPRKP